ncbi:MAG TPA: DUF885 domain-containing protein [Acidimicrobiia bacterium]|nr:DUF885 domain-containing protein [Acidimicrobiia bacterium]
MSDLHALLDGFVSEHLERHPVSATALGAPGLDDRLGDFSADAFDERRRDDEAWLARFEAVPDDGLPLDDRIDRDLAISVLRGRRVMHDWEGWRRSPDDYLGACLYGPFYLFLHRLRPESELVADAAARLDRVGEVLDHGRRNLDASLCSPLLVKRALGMCQAGIAYARQLLPAEVTDERLRAVLADAGERAASAFTDFAVFLEALAEEANGPYAIGEGRYTRLLREQEGLAHDAASLREAGRAAYDDIAAAMAQRARTLTGSDDFRAALEELNDDAPGSPEEMRDLYADWTERARTFLAEHALVTFPEGERCEVEPSPPFQRPVLAVASYSRPPAFTDSRIGHFFVPFPPEGASDEEVRQRLRTNSRHLIPSIAVHEAYPGHHWHLAVAAGNERQVRKVFGTSYFAEGWALYTEQMMREHGFFDVRQELQQLDMRLFRAARIVVDTSLHMEEMDVDEAVRFMQDRAGLTEPVARAEVARYCAWPTQAASYLTGSLEIERIRERYLGEPGHDLRGFHDAMAASGVLPLHLAERAVCGD